MKLNINNLKDDFWKEKNYHVPCYDINEMINNTKNCVKWVHFGAGNIFRMYIARLCDDLLEKNIIDTGLVVAETYDYELIEKLYKPYDNLSIAVTLNQNGNIDKRIIGSIAESLVASYDNKDFDRLKNIFSNQNLSMVSFTITEKGYSLKKSNGEYSDIVLNDFVDGIEKPNHAIAKISSLLYERYKNGAYPITLASMDNCSKNGDKLKESVVDICKHWYENNLVDKGFIDYILDGTKISFPYSMIDKITPRPSDVVLNMLKEDGVEDVDCIITDKKTYASIFVNAEKPEYLVVEDNFTNGKIPLDKVGVYFADRETVEKTEKMKVMTCLNPLHTALAVYGCLFGYTHIAKEMDDLELSSLVKKIGYDEGLKVVINPKIIEPKKFIDEVVYERLPNYFLPDMPQRIATDTSQKVGIRFGETIKGYINNENLEVKSLTYIPLAIAGWLRYLMGLDDDLNKFECSSDPLLSELQNIIKNINIGDKNVDCVDVILSNKNIFGSDLISIGLGDKIKKMLIELIEGKGAVRKTLNKYV